jgi:hypothetical protein
MIKLQEQGIGVAVNYRPIHLFYRAMEKIVKKGKNRKKLLDITGILDNKLIKSFGRGMKTPQSTQAIFIWRCSLR